MNYLQFRAMNTDIVLAAEGDAGQLAKGFEQTRKFIAEMESRFTRFSETSELSELNRSAGSWFQASDELFEVVRTARDLYEQTGGLFDPTLLDALQAVGYDRSMDEMRKMVSMPMVPGLLPRAGAGLRGMLLNPETKEIRLPGSVRLDLGGVAKGWIAQQAALRLAEFCSACAVNAGGDLYLVETPPGESDWQIGLEDPRDSSRSLAALRVRSGAVATSSITRRRWLQAGKERHHILDPRTGLPAETDWLSVTVFAPEAAAAEAFAKACLIAGSQQAGAVISRRPGLEFIGVRNDGTLWGSDHSKEYLDYANEYSQPALA